MSWGLLLVGLLFAACAPAPEDGDGMEVGTSGSAEAPSGGVDLSPPFGLTSPMVRPQRSALSGPAVAYGDGVYLIVWEDTRPGGLFAARMEPDGTLLDPTGLALNAEPERRPSGDPSVAFDGTDFVVVWRDPSEGIFGRRVSPEGELGPRFTVITSDEIGGGPPGLACSPAVCLVTFEGIGDLGTAILARRVARDGTVLDRPSALLLSPELEGLMGDATVAWNGERFLVVWTDARGGEATPDIWGGRVLPDGTLLDGRGGGFPIATAPGVQRNPAVTWTGTRFLVVWDDTRRGGEPDIFATRVRPSGAVSEPGGIPISSASGAQRFPRVTPYGGKSLIVWEDRRSGASRVRGARITEAGELVDTSSILISEGDHPEERLPSVAAGGEKYLVAWAGGLESSGAGPFYILGKRVSRPGEVLDDTARFFTRSANRQEEPAIAAAGSMYLAVWRETRPPEGPALYAARLRPDGSVLDSGGIRLPSGTEPEQVQVASDGRDFLVVWAEREPTGSFDKDVRAVRVSHAGDVLDATGLPLVTLAGDQELPSVAFFGGVYLVVWEDERGRGTGIDPFAIYGTRVTPGGAVLDPAGRRFGGPDSFKNRPAVGHDGEHFLVVWLDDAGGLQLRGERVTPAGGSLDPTGFFIVPASGFESGPALSFDGDNVLVVWAQWLTGTNFADVYGTRVTSEGMVLDAPFLIASGPGGEGFPRVAFDGTYHVVAWERDEDEVLFGLDAVPDVYVSRVTPEGEVVDFAGIPLATDPIAEERNLAVASLGGGRTVLLYEAWLRAPHVNALRIQARVLETDTGLHLMPLEEGSAPP